MSDIATTFDATLNRFKLTSPLTLADVEVVWRALRAAIVKPYHVEVFHRHDELTAIVFDATGAKLLERTVTAI